MGSTVTYKVAFCVVSANDIHKGAPPSLGPFFPRERRRRRERLPARNEAQRSEVIAFGSRRDPEPTEGTTSIEIRFRRRGSIVRTSPVLDSTEDKGKRPIRRRLFKKSTGLRSINLFFLPRLSTLLLLFLVSPSTSTKRKDWLRGEIWLLFSVILRPMSKVSGLFVKPIRFLRPLVRQ